MAHVNLKIMLLKTQKEQYAVVCEDEKAYDSKVFGNLG